MPGRTGRIGLPSGAFLSGGKAPRRRRGGLRSIVSVRSVVGQMFVLQLVVVLLLAAVAGILLVLAVQREGARAATQRSLAVAEGFAHAPGIVKALEGRDPATVLGPEEAAARHGSGVDFLTAVNRQALRSPLTLPGRADHLLPLLAGRTVTERAAGSHGSQYRAFVPVENARGTVVGAVSAGVTEKSTYGIAARGLPDVLGITAGAVAVTTAGAALVSRRLLRQTHGLGPDEITRLYEHHDAVLHAVREGVVIIDASHRLLLVNDEAQRLLELPSTARGRPVDELRLAPPIAELLASGREAVDELHLAGSRVLAVNQRPLDRYGLPAGSVATLRDSTELQTLSGKAEAARERLSVLYDASVSIGTTLDVTRTAQELAEVAVPPFADCVTVDLAEAVILGDEPGDTDTRMLRIATATATATAGVREEPTGRTPESVGFLPDTPEARSLATGRAVLEPDLRNAHGWRATAPECGRRALDRGLHSLITAPLCARGTVLGVASFYRLESHKPYEDDDLELAEELAGRAAVCIDNARRYTREHALAVTLQRSLLPRGLPEQNGLDVGYRYLPAQKGVGGDWFDVIPLPGARVALVVGDVVGQGLHAAATMGRLRTAVRNFSSLDLPPDELLARLDELTYGDEDEETADLPGGMVGASCLYAVYDPVERRCTLARAGHLPPALVLPDRTVEYLELPAGPLLGVGGLPFESMDRDIPEGSEIVLYTDGLVEHREGDLDDRLGLLAGALSRADGEPDEVCGAVLDALLPENPHDDIALLVARTRVVPEDRIARWDVPRDPAAVGRIRTAVADRLDVWGLPEDIGFVTELVLSELITNALRHAEGPIGVRLVLDRKLICEVSDGSSTAPHLRYAEATDEGGRGLFLVAQLAERWGTRYTPQGKVIWSEQPVPGPAQGRADR
ncbi:GAF domain-containing protein [Streptomyces nodosus]|uniref:protein-serine/threonine phosphatase n=2 Tax=Streptomyces nodosus TaxID=40318 RepID=A0A5P2VWN1_9ACTN|nr:GAF domain-containing protein [Streptomyces nodosus]